MSSWRSTRWMPLAGIVSIFDAIAVAYSKVAAEVGITDVTCIPISALQGDNIVSASPNMTWYSGPTLLAHLETVRVGDDLAAKPFRMPVQWVNRPDQSFRGYSGTIASGVVGRGDRVAVLPSGQAAHIARIVTMDGDLDFAAAGEAVTLTLDAEIDVSRGDLFAADTACPVVAEQFAVHLIWMDESAIAAGPLVSSFCQRQLRERTGHGTEIQNKCWHAPAYCREASGSQRDRVMQYCAGSPAAARYLRGKSGNRQLHSHRSLHVRHRRLRDGHISFASRHQHSLAAAQDR